jgi:signal transduction histidine kinase
MERTVPPLLTLEIRYEHDVVFTRQRARQVAQLLGFDTQDQTRMATAVSELARNAYEYAGGGRARFGVEGDQGETQRFVIRISDDGPGICDVQDILDGKYVSHTGMGLGILGARRLSEHFRIESAPGKGTCVEIAQSLPPGASFSLPSDAARIAAALAQRTAQSPMEEIQRQNQELLQALDEIRERQLQVERLNAELEATNRGVLALYAELEDRAEDLRRTSEQKSRFLSDMSHELRTPLTAALNLTKLVLSRTDGELTDEQEHQVTLIRQAIESVSSLVNDLLDLAKIEAGRTTLRPAEFTVSELFAALRGICRPLLVSNAVTLSFEDRSRALPLHTDDQRLAQILRNLLSNAIKFTERGEIRVVASDEGDEMLRFSVSDTGIGIAAEDRERIFGQYVQIEGPVQRRVRGTGLGLPLSRKLATLLGGRIELDSVLGRGSTFAVIVPRHCVESGSSPAAGRDAWGPRAFANRGAGPSAASSMTAP